MLPGKNVSKWWYLLVIASCLHLFFINIKDSHDWGDDFAQYIHQAENISKGIPQTETGYIFNKDYALYSPPLYFIGFPLVLAPVYAIAGNKILAFSYLISAFLFFSALIFFRFFNSYFKPFTSYLLVLIIVCNPWMLDYKMEIGSDIPFTFFLFLSVLFYLNSKKSAGSFILLGMFAGFLISIRSIGVAFALAVVMNELLKIKQETGRKKKKQTGLMAIIFLMACAAFFVVLNNVIFNIPLVNLQSSASLFTFNDLYKTFLKNCNYYFDIFQSFFTTPPENIYALFSTLIKSIALSLLLLGFYLRIKRGMEFIDFLLIFYMLVLYVYPYSASGYRFLIPVTPVLLLLVAEGLYFLMSTLQWKKHILYGVCIISFYAVYKYDWDIILNKQNYILPGPQRLASKSIFDFIENNTEKNAHILFKKPRALALYTGRNCFVNSPDVSSEKLQQQIKEYSIGYILINEEISDDAAKDFVSNHPANMQLVYNNDVYRFYKLITNDK